ncbi:hypothetical protein [Chryseobacterium sp.]|uniref:hypothetical protein n=1 Tax=Chryseobacterium sp. TaxID=1871047 RepID=UPI00289EC900|nr:hypothetical protein [Chryseobacterium sp.]
MNPIKVKLTSGEVLLMERDVVYLKPIIDAAFSSLYEVTYLEIKGQKPEETRSTLAKLSFEELINIAKCDDLNPVEGQFFKILQSILSNKRDRA